MKAKSLSRVQLFSTPWTAAYQAPPSMGFSRQEYWSGVPLPSPQLLSTQHNSASPLQKLHSWNLSISPTQFSSVAQSCPTLCDPMDCCRPGFPVHHQLLELAQTHVHQQWCHPTISSSVAPLLLLSLIFPTIRVFSNESVLRIRWPKYWSFLSFSISLSNEFSGLISFRIDWFDLLAIQETLSILSSFLTSK